MKRIFAWILLVVMLVGTLAGCGCQKRQEITDPTVATTAPVVGDTNVQDVIDYLKAIYKDDGAETFVDFERFGIVRIAGVPYEVVWTVDVSEDLVKVVVNDDGTVTIDVNEKCETATPYVLTATVTGEDGTTASHSWNYILPEAVDMVSIVKAAYELANGQSMDYEVTLTGEITKVDTPYSEDYKNITVTIVVEGAEDMPIMCYRLKGEGADELQIGDTITVTGTLKNYNGTIEFDAGCILEAVTPGERVKAPEDPKQIVDEAYALGANQSLKYEATLTGKITQIKDPYSDQYKNITVIMVVEGRENKPITCYRMKGAGADDLDVGDTITVKGYITNYVGSAGYSTIEFTAGCQLIAYENTGKEFIMPGTAAGIVNLAYSLKDGEALPEKATLTGVVTSVESAYSSQYKNVTVVMVIGDMYDKPITCYRMKGTGADVIDEDYTITVTGVLKNYKGKIEFDTGCTLDSYKAPAKPQGPAVSYEGNVVDVPKVDTPYKLGMVQKNIAGEPTLYFSGNLANTYYLSTSKDGAKAVDVMLKAANGGYYLAYTAKGGSTMYINMLQVTTDKLHTNLEISATPKTVYTYDETLKTLTVKMPDGNTYYIGTYSEYTTLSASDVTKISGSFPTHFLELTTVSGPASMEEGVKQLKGDYPEGYGEDYKLPTSVKVRDDVFAITWKVVTDDPSAVAIKDGKLVFVRQVDEVPYKLVATLTKGNETIETSWEYAVPRKPAAIEVVTAPEIGKAYKLALTQENLGGSVLFLNGKRDGNYFATTDKSYEAVDVYAEKAGNGYRVYFMDNGVKTYVDMYEYQADKIGVAFNTTLTDTSAIYKIDKTNKALVATFDIAGVSESRYLGTYNEHSTMSSGKIFTEGEIDGFPAMFVIVNEETPVTLNAAAQELKKNLPESEGDIAESVKLPKEVVLNQKTFTVTWSVTPADSAAAKLVGDELVITRPTNGAANFTLKAVIKDAAGETKEVTWTYTVPDAADTALTIEEAIALGLSMEHNTYTTLKYMVTGEITEVYNAQYGNMYIKDAAGNKLTIYGTYSADGSARYDAMEVKPVAGDTVTIYGVVGQYNGTAQIKNGWIVEHVPADPGTDVPEETEPSTEPTEPAEIDTIAEALAGASGAEFTVKGVVTAVDSSNIYLQDATGAICVRMKAKPTDIQLGDTVIGTGTRADYNGLPQLGNGTYVKSEGMTLSAKTTTIDALTTADICTYVKFTNLTVTKVDDLGGTSTTPNVDLQDANGNTIQIYKAVIGKTGDAWDLQVGDVVDVTAAVSYYNKFQLRNTSATEITKAGAVAPDPTETTAEATTEATTETTTATEPSEPSNVLTIEEAIAMGVAKDHNTYTEEKYSVTGVITEVYGTTYGNMYITDASGKVLTIYGTYSADGTVRYDAMEVKPVAGDTVTILGVVGQYNGTAQIKNGWLVAHEPALSIEAAIEMGAAKEHNTYTAEKYNVVGVITEVYNTQYGNMKVSDEAGNILTIYGTYSADGQTRYDAMEVKPVAGDTVILTGIIGQYNGTPQMKNGWLMYHKAKPSAETTTLTIAEAIAMGASKEHNTYTTEKYMVTGVISEVYNTQYGNMKLADDAGNVLTVYGTYNEDGTVRYDAMEVKPVAGDTVTVFGIIGQYNGTPQMKNGWIVAHTAAGGSAPTEPTEPEATEPTNPAPSTGAYAKVTSAADFTSGSYVMVVSSGYAAGNLDGTWVSFVQPTVSGDTVTNAAGGVWTLTVNGNTAKITDANGVSIKPSGANTNGIASGDFDWSWSFENGVFKFYSEADTVTLASNVTSGQAYTNKFRAYKNSTVTGSNAASYLTEFTLYKLVTE